MAGIYGIYSKQSLDKISNVYDYFYSSKLNNILNEEGKYENFIYGRSVIKKYLNDRVLYENDKYILAYEGLVFNKTTEKSNECIINWYEDYGLKFLEKIKGFFSGFLFLKESNDLIIFNDHLSTKTIYYYHSKDYFIFSSELKVISKLLKILNVDKYLDLNGANSLLTYGYMLSDCTIVKNVKKLEYGSILNISENLNITYNKYYEIKNTENNELTKIEIINTVDKLLLESVQNLWNKDLEYGYNHLSFLSGGLDSRVDLLLAKEMGFNNTMTLTFSQNESSDDKIAKKISSNENFYHLFFSLDNGKFLEDNYYEHICANDGLVSITGSAAGYNFLKLLNLDNYGGLHSGQIGDVLFGSFSNNKINLRKSIMSNMQFLIDETPFLLNIISKYKSNPEMFSIEQRQINNTLNGDRILSHFIDILSPFYDRELLDFALSIPKKYKKDEAIYLDWFNKMHPSISKYKWEKAGVRPINKKITNYAKLYKRYKNAIIRRLGFNINNMNPFDVWIRKNKNILINLDFIFNNNINFIKDNDLKKNLILMYKSNVKYSYYGRINKFLVITFLLAYKLHFLD